MKQFKISTTAGAITIKSDPTLGPREFRFEQSTVNPFMVTSTGETARVTCARCSHAFTSRPDGFVDEALENEIAAHQERCFVVGDHVRWDNPATYGGIWIEGELMAISDSMANIRASSGTLAKPGQHIDVGLYCAPLRRIPRPQQDDNHDPAKCAMCTSGNTWHHQGGKFTSTTDQVAAVSQVQAFNETKLRHLATPMPKGNPTGISATYGAQPVPVLYDGLTGLQCYFMWCDNRADVERGGAPSYAMTEAQIAAGRAEHLAADGHLRSAQLRAKIASSAEAERLQVRIDSSDHDDFPW